MRGLEGTASGSGGWLSGLVDALVGLMDAIGPAGAGLAVAAENLFPPIPSEAILPLAGLAASRGAFPLWEAIAWTTLGSLVGALVLYGVGALVGAERLARVADRVPLLHARDVHRTAAWFERHGPVAVFVGRFVPVFRSLISIPAGVVRMPLWKFALYTGAGSLVWNTVFVLIGWYLGASWRVIEPYLDVFQNVVLVALAAALAAFAIVRVRAAIRAGRQDRPPRD